MPSLAIDNSPTTEWAAIDSAGSTAQSRTPVTTLTQDDFLRLLVSQMTNQDPLKPMEDMSSFMQMAQFSTLEQTKSMQQSMATIHANSMLGQVVQVKGTSGEPLIGLVQQVLMIDGTPQLLINGQRYTLDKVEAIGAPTAPALPAASTKPATNATQPPTPDIGAPPSPPFFPELGLPPQVSPESTLGAAPVNAVAALLGAPPVL